MKCRPSAGAAFSTDSPAIALHNALANRKAQSGSRELIFVQTLEKSEDSLRVLGLESDAVILKRDHPIRAVPTG